LGILALITKTSQKRNLTKEIKTVLVKHTQKTKRIIRIERIFKITKTKADSAEDISYWIKKTKKVAIAQKCHPQEKL